jgi:hypothetical protein
VLPEAGDTERQFPVLVAVAVNAIAEEIEHGEMTPAADMLQFSVAA